MSFRRHHCLLPLALALATFPVVSHAQQQPQTNPPANPITQPAQALDPSVVTEARRAYDEGSGLYVAGRYFEALIAFERAYSLRPNPVVLLPILECHDRMGHVPEAIRTLETYLRALPEARNRTLLEARLENLRRRPARVHIVTTPSGARVSVDGRAIEQTTPTDVELTPGTHTIVATMPGHLTASHEFETLPGAARDEQLVLERDPTNPRVDPNQPGVPSETTPVRPSRGPSAVVWVAASVAGAGIIMGTTFGLFALSANNDYDTAPNRETRDSGLRNALISDVSFGVAAASGVFALVMYLVERNRAPASAAPSEPVSARLHLGPGALRVEF